MQSCSSYLETDGQLVDSFLYGAMNCDIRTVDRILRDGMPVDVRYEDNRKVRNYATRSNRTDVIKHLLHEGADFNRQTLYKGTPLHLNSKYNYNEVTRLLIDNGADIKLKNKYNKSQLYRGHSGSEYEVCSYRLNKVHH